VFFESLFGFRKEKKPRKNSEHTHTYRRLDEMNRERKTREENNNRTKTTFYNSPSKMNLYCKEQLFFGSSTFSLTKDISLFTIRRKVHFEFESRLTTCYLSLTIELHGRYYRDRDYHSTTSLMVMFVRNYFH